MAPPDPLRPADPERIGDYRLTGRLGQGGQGVVYRALRPGGEPVAVKLMHARLDDDRARRRFADEVRAIRRVAPFCTAQVLDADLDGDRPYIVSEYVDGVSLHRHVATEGPLAGGSLDRIAVGTATALAAIHGAGVVHRDLKPGNVLLGLEGPRVIDFGISRMMGTVTTTGQPPVGTPAYISPEQLKGERAGPAADMFGWALTVAFTASGRHAYAARSFEATLGRILFGEPDLGPLAGPLREIVVACLAADPADRPGAEEALRLLIGTGPAPALMPRHGVLETGATLATAPPWRAADAPAGPAQGRHAPGTTVPGEAEEATGDRHGGPDAATEGHTGSGAGAAPGSSARPGRRRRGRWAALAGLAVVAAVVAFGAVWSTGRRGPGGVSYAGTWTGSAEHPAAGRVFPVEIRLPTGADIGTMLWGADLHCSGRLTPAGARDATAVFRLDRVRGDQCHQGTLLLSPLGDGQVSFEVSETAGAAPRYAGTAARLP
ncbi:serine/threonine-protein kinase [Sphaerisporangium sp. NPDC005289]|uniref:serine/threonine-protein kinase n=1 Tax=Sphaerisporangium sp. NPDC005289 TaxID=3155247 RepID=UPI0033ABA6A2